MGIAGLVPGRECDGCMVCCIVPAIDDPALHKKAGDRCRHCERGCNIYETRPLSCRVFYCAWRVTTALGAEWRPDRSGVLSWFEDKNVDGRAVRSITLMLTRNAEEILSNRDFLNYVRDMILAEQRTFLARPGWDRYRPLRVLINSSNMSAAAQLGAEAVGNILNQAWDFLRCQEPLAQDFQYMPSPSASSIGHEST